MQHDVHFAGKPRQRRVEPRGVLRLIERDRCVVSQAVGRRLRRLVQLTRCVRVEPVGRFQQFVPNCLGVFVSHFLRSDPIPDFRLFRAEIPEQLSMIARRLDDGTA